MFEGLQVDSTEVVQVFTRAPWGSKVSIVVDELEQATTTATSTPADTIDFFVDGVISREKAGVGIWSTTGTRHCGKVHPAD